MKLALLILLAFFVAVHLAGCLMGRREALSAPDDGAPPCRRRTKSGAPARSNGPPISKTKRAHARPFGRAFFYGFGRRRKTAWFIRFFCGVFAAASPYLWLRAGAVSGIMIQITEKF